MTKTRRSGIAVIVAVLLSAFCFVGVAYADYSKSSVSRANNYTFYAAAQTMSKQVTGSVNMNTSRIVNPQCIGACPRIFLPKGTLKATGSTKYNAAAIPSGGEWGHRVTVGSVAGISYYSKGLFYFGQPGGYYQRETAQTALVKHQN